MRLNATKVFTSAGLFACMALAVANVAQASTENLFTPPTNLTAWWRFDELPSATIASNAASAYQLTRQGGAIFAAGCTNNGLVVADATFGSTAFAQAASTDPSVDFGTGNFTLRASVQLAPGNTPHVRTILDHRLNGSGPGYSLYISFGHPGV